MKRTLGLILTLGVLSAGIFSVRSADAPATKVPKPDFDYIAWDLHRYSSTPEQIEIDAKWVKDLGFTHTYVGDVQGLIKAKDPKKASKQKEKDPNKLAPGERIPLFIQAMGKQGIVTGLKISIDRDTKSLAATFGVTEDELVQRGMVFGPGPQGAMNKAACNPYCPEIINGYAEKFSAIIREVKQKDTHDSLRLFLMGSEMGWSNYKSKAGTESTVTPQAMAFVEAAAREDGFLKPDEKFDPTMKIPNWVNAPHGKGRDWRIRNAFEAAVLKDIPNADFMIDPIWALKIVNGFGAMWNYVRNDPKNIAQGVISIKSASWPSPAAESVQLISGATHDTVMEGNLLALCFGIDKLYHWGIHNFEPGAFGSARAFLKKGEPDTEENQKAGLEKAIRKRKELEPALRTTGRLLRERGAMFRDWKPTGNRLGLVGEIKETSFSLMVAHIPFDVIAPEFAIKRIKDFKVIGFGELEANEEQYETLKQALANGSTVLIPKDCKMPEGKEPLKGTQTWSPLSPDMLDSIHNAEAKMAKNSGGADAKKAKGKMAKSLDGAMNKLSSLELRTQVTYQAKILREELIKVGLQPYADTATEDIILNSYEYQGQKIAFVVNDKRTTRDVDEDDDDEAPSEDGQAAPAKTLAPKKVGKAKTTAEWAAKGVAVDIDIVFHEKEDGIRIINIDTGKEVPATKMADGWHVKETLEPAWYRLYAVLKKGEEWKGPKPFEAAPALKEFTVAAGEKGIKLSWKLPFEDWVGCDIQDYNIYRGEADAKPELLKTIYGHIPQDAGGMITEYVDASAKPGVKYSYQIQAVTPLHQPGPMTELASATTAAK